MADATLKLTIDAGPAIESIAEVQELIRSHAALRAEVERRRTTIKHVAAIAHCGGWVGLREDQALVYVRALTVGGIPRGSLDPSLAALNDAIRAARAAQGEQG